MRHCVNKKKSAREKSLFILIFSINSKSELENTRTSTKHHQATTLYTTVLPATYYGHLQNGHYVQYVNTPYRDVQTLILILNQTW